ncbi:MAG: hypothetical protein K2M19_07645 [Muribaculaceae bacterium]|nr:hypothetical protein [Muribaculaceae bacterium]
MKHFLLTVFALLSISSLRAVDIAPAAYEYSIRYHWGLIDETAASASVFVQCNDGNFFGTLAGRSIDWDGRYFEVTDTLDAYMSPEEGNPLPRQDVRNCIGWYRKPTVDQLRSGCYDPASPENYVNTAGQGWLDASESTLRNITTTANLLAAYYYGQTIDFDALTPGQTLSAPCGVDISVSLNYNGTTEWNGRPVRDLTITYSGADVPVRCLIDSETGVPLLFSASLIIGEVEMTLV